MGIVVFGFVSVLVTYKDGSEEEQDIYSKDFVVVEGNQPERDERGNWKCAVLFKAFAHGYNVVAVVNHVDGEKTVCRIGAEPGENGDPDRPIAAAYVVQNGLTFSFVPSY